MSNKKKNHVEEYFVLKKKVMGRITGFFVLIIMVVQPLIVTDFYFNILQTKYYCYWISMVSMFFLLLCASGYFMYIDKRDFGFENTDRKSVV